MFTFNGGSMGTPGFGRARQLQAMQYQQSQNPNNEIQGRMGGYGGMRSFGAMRGIPTQPQMRATTWQPNNIQGAMGSPMRQEPMRQAQAGSPTRQSAYGSLFGAPTQQSTYGAAPQGATGIDARSIAQPAQQAQGIVAGGTPTGGVSEDFGSAKSFYGPAPTQNTGADINGVLGNMRDVLANQMRQRQMQQPSQSYYRPMPQVFVD